MPKQLYFLVISLWMHSLNAFYAADCYMQREESFWAFCGGLNAELADLTSKLSSLSEANKPERAQRLEDQILRMPVVVDNFHRLREGLDSLLEPIFSRFDKKLETILASHDLPYEYCTDKDHVLSRVYASMFWFVHAFLKKCDAISLRSWLNDLRTRCEKSATRFYLWVSKVLSEKLSQSLSKDLKIMLYDDLAPRLKRAFTGVEAASTSSLESTTPEGHTGNAILFPEITLVEVFDTSYDLIVEDWPPVT